MSRTLCPGRTLNHGSCEPVAATYAKYRSISYVYRLGSKLKTLYQIVQLVQSWYRPQLYQAVIDISLEVYTTRQSQNGRR